MDTSNIDSRLGAPDSLGPSPNVVSPALFLIFPTVAMSLGWGLRGTIGGGQIGAMIPGAIVTLCLCQLLGWKRSLGIVVAIGTVGVGLGGQETYGQTIGFLREPGTVLWGLAGLTIKGAAWGLSGGLLIGLGIMHERYRPREIAAGLLLMIAGTTLGWMFVDFPKLAYFSNRVDKPREEIWVGLTAGALALLVYLLILRKETVSATFARWGLFFGGAGFGIGGAFIALGNSLPQPYSAWPWWKVMEFTFGALFGLGMGGAAYRLRHELAEFGGEAAKAESEEPKAATAGANGKSAGTDRLAALPLAAMIVLGLVVAVGGLWLNFSFADWGEWLGISHVCAQWLGKSTGYRAVFTLIAALLVMVALVSDRLAWHIALSMTAAGFIRDYIHRQAETGGIDKSFDTWTAVAITSVSVVVLVALAEANKRLTPLMALLGMVWLSTLFGLVKVGFRIGSGPDPLFVPVVFVAEALITTLLVFWISSKQKTAT